MRSAARNAARFLRRLATPSGRPAIGTVQEVAAVYDDVYEHSEKYDSLDASNAPKLKYVLDYVKGINGQVLDAGSGRGSVLRYMLDNGVNALGIELSASACSMYLQGLPVENIDIVSHASTGKQYAGLVNTDVLEHIPPDQLDGTIDALKRLAPTAFLGIANHSSVHNGHELHVIQEGIGWWVRRLANHYARIQIIVPDKADVVLWDHFQHERFFFVVAER